MYLSRWQSQKKSSGKEDRRPSNSSDQTNAPVTGHEPTPGVILRSNTQWSKASSDSSSVVVQKGAKMIEIKCQTDMNSIKFLDAGKCVVSGGQDCKIRQWQVQDGAKMGKPILVKSVVHDIAVSPDGKWIVCGAWGGLVTVWNAMTHAKTIEFAAHSDWVHVVDISSDATSIATGSHDKTACVWSLSTGKRLLSRLTHDNRVAAVKFSPNGRLVSTATWKCSSVRVYDSQNGYFLVNFSLEVISNDNQSLVWSSDDRKLFALAVGGNIHCLDVSTGTTLSQWGSGLNCITLARNGMLIAASASSSILFWDAATYKPAGAVDHYRANISCIAVSSNDDLATVGGKTITIQSLYDILPSHYFDDAQSNQEMQYVEVEKRDLDECESPHQNHIQDSVTNESGPIVQMSESEGTSGSMGSPIQPPCVQEENSIVRLERTVQELRDEVARYQHAANTQKNKLNGIVKSFCSDLDVQPFSDPRYIVIQEQDSLDAVIDSFGVLLRTWTEYSENKTTRLEQTNQELRIQLEVSNQENTDLRTRDERSGCRIAYLDQTNEELRTQLVDAQQAVDALLRINHVHEQKYRCETLYAHGRIRDAAESLLKMVDIASEDVKGDKLLFDWTNEFTHRCVVTLEGIGDAAALAGKRDEAVTAYSTALLLNPSPPNTLLTKWTSVILVHGKAHEVLSAATEFKFSRFHIYRAVCNILQEDGRLMEAVECFQQMQNELPETHDERMAWELDFRGRCIRELEELGDTARDSKQHDEAIGYYSRVLSLDPMGFNEILLLTRDTVLTKWTSLMLVRGSAYEALNTAIELKVPKFLIYRAVCDTLEADDHLTDAVEFFRQMRNDLQEDAGTDDRRMQWVLDFCERCIERLDELGNAARDSKNHHEAIRYYSTALSLDLTNYSVLLKRSDEMIELDPSSYEGYQEKHTALHAMGRYDDAFQAYKKMFSILKQSPNPQLHELRHRYIDATTTIKKLVEQTIRDMPHVLIDTVTGHLYDKTQQAAAFEELPVYNELRSSMTTQLDRPRIRNEVRKFYGYVMLSHRWQPDEPTFQMVGDMSIYGLPASPGNDKVQRFCELVRTLGFRWAWSDTCCVNQLDKGIQQESLVAMFRWYRGSSLTIVHLLGVFSGSQETDSLWRSVWNTRGWTYQEYVASNIVEFYTEDWKPYLGLDIFNHKESPLILREMERAMNFTTRELATLQPGLDKAREKLYLASTRQTTREEDIAYSLFGIFNVALPIIYGEGNQAVGRLLEHVLTRSDNVTLLAWTGNSGGQHSYLPTDLTVYNLVVPPHVPPPIESAEMDDMVMALRSSLLDHSTAIALYDRLYDLPPLSLIAGRLKLPGIVFPLSNPILFLESDPETDLPVYHATSPMIGKVEIKTTERLAGMRGLLLIHPWISPLLDQDFSCDAPLFDHATRALRLVVRLRQSFGGLLLAPLGRVQCKRVAADSLIKVQIREEISLTELIGSIRTVDVQ